MITFFFFDNSGITILIYLPSFCWPLSQRNGGRKLTFFSSKFQKLNHLTYTWTKSSFIWAQTLNRCHLKLAKKKIARLFFSPNLPLLRLFPNFSFQYFAACIRHLFIRNEMDSTMYMAVEKLEEEKKRYSCCPSLLIRFTTYIYIYKTL